MILTMFPRGFFTSHPLDETWISHSHLPAPGVAELHAVSVLILLIRVQVSNLLRCPQSLTGESPCLFMNHTFSGEKLSRLVCHEKDPWEIQLVVLPPFLPPSLPLPLCSRSRSQSFKEAQRLKQSLALVGPAAALPFPTLSKAHSWVTM